MLNSVIFKVSNHRMRRLARRITADILELANSDGIRYDGTADDALQDTLLMTYLDTGSPLFSVHALHLVIGASHALTPDISTESYYEDSTEEPDDN